MKYNKEEMETDQVNYKAFADNHLRVSEHWTTGIHLEHPIFLRYSDFAYGKSRLQWDRNVLYKVYSMKRGFIRQKGNSKT